MENGDKNFENILGIDYGLRNIGLAVSYGFLAEPVRTLKVKDKPEAIKKIKRIIKEKQISKVVLGITEKEMADKTKDFAQALREATKLPVVLWDETLTTHEARQKMFESGRPRAKRKTAEHQIAACLILQEYLDSLERSC